MDNMLEGTATRIFRDWGHDRDRLWAMLEESGLTRLWVREEEGGFDLGLADGFGLIRLSGAFAAPVPLAETLLSSWLLTRAAIPVPEGAISLFIDGWQRGVPFGDFADHVVRIDGTSVTLHVGKLEGHFDVVGADRCSKADFAGEPLATGALPDDYALPFAALGRAAQICGALDATLDLTLEFADQREQFGRPLTKFQAIQHMLSEMGSEGAAASATTDVAVMKTDMAGRPDKAAIAVAKYRAGMASSIVAEHGHQIHGAIGYTEEYGLARLTRRLWQWREDFGGESYWATELGRDALCDAEPLWPKIAG